MQGKLESSNLSDVLLGLHLTKRSGILRLSRQDVKKSIYFLDGSIVFAHSNHKADRLGETLLRLGKISLEDFELASREVIEKGKRLGQALSDLGLISAQEVNSSVHYQLQQIIYSIFDWDSGDYEFVERERPVFEDIMVDVSTPNLLMDGIRNATNPIVLARYYQNNENQILQLNTGIPRLPRSDLDFAEETILACIDGTKTIESVRQLAHLSPIEFDRGLCSLLVCGMLQLQTQEDASANAHGGHQTRPIPQAGFTTQPFAKQESARFKTLSEEELRRLINMTIQKLKDATDEEILNVLPDCTLREIDKAYEDLSSQFHPPYYSQSRFLDVKDNLKEILDRLTLAHDNLIRKFRSHIPLAEGSLTQKKPGVSEQAAGPEPSRSYEKSQTPMRTPVPEREFIQNLKPQETPSRPIPVSRQEHTPFPEKEPISQMVARLKQDPSNTALLRRLGRRYQETGKPHEGEKQLLRALELEPQSVENHFALADFYQTLGLKIKAFKHLNIVLQIEPNNARALELLNVKRTRKALYEIES